MSKGEKPVAVFLTAAWADIDDNIRKGKAPGGVPSVLGIWTTCLNSGFDVRVFICTYLERGWPRETVQFGGVRFYWIAMPMPRLARWLHERRLIGFAKCFSVMWQLKMLWRLVLSGVKPDLVYLMRPTFALVGYFWGRYHRAKVVLREYGTWIYAFWGPGGRWIERIRTLGEFMAMKLPTDLMIMTNDGSMGDKAAKLAGYPKERFRFWINGVDKDLWIPNFDKASAKRRIGLPSDSPVLMTLSRLAYSQRIDRALNAMPKVLQRFPGAHLIIVGGGPLARELREQAGRLGLRESVVFVGPVQHDQIRDYLNTCDIFIVCNDRSNLCNTLIEALAAGCCIVTRDVGETSTVAKHGVNSLVLSPGEADDIADAIILLLEHPELQVRLREAAHRYAMERFQSWDERMKMEVRALRELLA